MNWQTLDQVLAEAAPMRDADLRALDLDGAGAVLIEEIAAAPPSSLTADHVPEPTLRSAHRTGSRAIAAVVAAAVLLAVATLIGGGGVGGDQHPAFAAAAIKVAEENPRLLVMEPGWSVSRADEFTSDEGEMAFSNGQDELELFWRPANEFKSYARDRRADSSAQTPIEVLGQPATLFRYDDTSTGSPDFTTIIAPQGKTFVEVRGDALGSQDAYLDLLHSLQPTDVNTWLAAMPRSVVRPSNRATTVDRMLRGIPLPPGFRVAALKHGNVVSDHYQLGTQVAGSVACAWLDRWTAAAKAGDGPKLRQARAAMRSSRNWPILRELNSQGDYPEEIWGLRDRWNNSGMGRNTTRNYSSGLGCHYLPGR